MDYRVIAFTDVNKAEIIEGSADIGEYDICVKTKISTVSCGTERANITGNLNVSISDDIPEKAVFPRFCGYSSSGVVEDVGKKVTKFKIGDRVAMRGSIHRDFNIINEDCAVKIPDKISYEEAATAYISTFPAAAIRKTKVEFGESAAVMGLGVLGIMSVQLLHAAGAVPVIAVDPVKERRELALKFGADYAFDPTESDFVEKINKLTNGVNVVIEVTGVGKGLQQALDIAAKFGRVALLGCTRDKNFTIDYYRKVHGKGVTIVGAHTLARPQVESSHGMFTHNDDMEAVLKLCEEKRINLKDIIGGTFSPNDCQKVYDSVINDRSFPPIVQFDWEKLT